MKLWEINKLMTTDKLFKVSDEESVDMETGEVFQATYLYNLPIELEEKTKNVGLVIKSIEADKAQIDGEIARLQKMKKSCESKIESLKHYILVYGCEVKDVAVTIKFNPGRESVDIKDDAEIPEEYRSYKWSADKKAIKEALKAGKEVEGCMLIKKPTVTIK